MTTSPSNPSFTDCAGKPHGTSLEHNRGNEPARIGTTPSSGWVRQASAAGRRPPPRRTRHGPAAPVTALIPVVNARIMHRLIARSRLHVYRGGHLDLIAEPGRLAPVVEQFLDLT